MFLFLVKRLLIVTNYSQYISDYFQEFSPRSRVHSTNLNDQLFDCVNVYIMMAPKGCGLESPPLLSAVHIDLCAKISRANSILSRSSILWCCYPPSVDIEENLIVFGRVSGKTHAT